MLKINSQITRLSVVTVIAASLLAVGILTAISVVEEADARKNQASQSNSVRIGQDNNNGGRSSASITQRNELSP